MGVKEAVLAIKKDIPDNVTLVAATKTRTIEEIKEIERILAELTAKVGAQGSAIRTNFEILVEVCKCRNIAF